jgi:hypothetical protein
MRQPVEFQNKYKMKTFLGCYGDMQYYWKFLPQIA